MKVLLRQYEIVGAMSETFNNYKSVSIVDEEGVPLPEFARPKLKTFLPDDEETETNLAKLSKSAARDPEGVAREVLANG